MDYDFQNFSQLHQRFDKEARQIFNLPDRTSSLSFPLAWICLTSIRYINTHQ